MGTLNVCGDHVKDGQTVKTEELYRHPKFETDKYHVLIILTQCFHSGTATSVLGTLRRGLREEGSREK